MSEGEPYASIEAFIEHDQVDWMGDGVTGQLVTVMMSDDIGQTEPAVCGLWPAQARALAFELLAMAEHAERLTRHRREDER
ncbi:MAG: hypothetical protein ACLP50_03710 [Solirubrobacteraceae bacterium]|jgi:hypothetical protein